MVVDSQELDARAKRVKLVLMDVDGVLTDGKYFHVPNPAGGLFEVKQFDSQDGIALLWLHRYGFQTGLISGRAAESTAERARSSKMTYVCMGHTDKLPLFEEIVQKSGFSPQEIAYVGDDLTDCILLKRVGLAVATANAKPEVKAMAHYVTAVPGGSGALRDLTELLLKAQGLWTKVLAHYEVEY
ncbi:MAG TPA: HAD hydrolase family protein [Bryobacteraceae bacterium]|nr:HAD hydrolase family protein [Bryobacteraceae bacterium]HPT26559.1 HAD hydrolase family protein [Bryobacteraceae bacterium]